MRPIDADALREWLKGWIEYYNLSPAYVRALIDEQPTVDAVEVVRCKDCRYYMRSDELCEMIAARLHLYECGKQWNEDSFCCWGKRRGEEDER